MTSEKPAAGLLGFWAETIAGLVTTSPRAHIAFLLEDAGYALRMMRSNAGFTLAALVTLVPRQNRIPGWWGARIRGNGPRAEQNSSCSPCSSPPRVPTVPA
jgi:hypothetical protein